MAAAEVPMPADLFLLDDAPPITDEDIDRYFDAAERLASEAAVDLEVADEWLVTSEAPSYPAAADTARWLIEDDEVAAWAAGKLAEADAELVMLRERRDAYMEKIQAWYEASIRRPQRSFRFFEARLERFGLLTRDATGRKTVPLPAATIRTTEQKAAIEVLDEAAVAAWAEALPAEVIDARLDGDETLVERRPKVFVGPLRKVAQIGTIVDGVRFTLICSCGHHIAHTVPVVPDVETEPPFVVSCPDCDGDQVTVETSVREGVLEHPAVLGLDGEPVPGATIRPGSVTAKVTPNR